MISFFNIFNRWKIQIFNQLLNIPFLPLLNSQLMNFSIFVFHFVQLVISLSNHFFYITIVDTIEFELNKIIFPLINLLIDLLPITTLFLITRFAATTTDLFFWKSSLFHVVRNSLTSINWSENEEDIHIRFYLAYSMFIPFVFICPKRRRRRAHKKTKTLLELSIK